MRGVPYGAFDWITGARIVRFTEAAEAAEAEAEATAERARTAELRAALLSAEAMAEARADMFEPEDDGRYDAPPMTDEDYASLAAWVESGCPDEAEAAAEAEREANDEAIAAEVYTEAETAAAIARDATIRAEYAPRTVGDMRAAERAAMAARAAAAEAEADEREAAERAAMAARAATPQRFVYSAPGMSTRFTPTEADLIALGYSAESRVIVMFGATFYRDSTRYPEAMPRTIARWFHISREAAAEMHDDTSGLTYTRAGEVDGTRYEAHYETANGMLTIFH
jgi:hypothetical protein